MIYTLDGNDYIVYITRKNNKNTYIRIKEDLGIYVTTNFLTTKSQVKHLLDQNQNYLKKVIQKQLVNNAKKEQFYYLGKPCDIIYMDTKEVEFIGNRIYIKDEAKLNNWYKKEMKKLFKEELDKIYNQFEENIPYPNLKIRKMTSRWGVCNRKNNNVTLNSELMRYSIDKLDYVIVHELSHFVHFNHSSNFWKLVSKYCPKYKEIRKELRS